MLSFMAIEIYQNYILYRYLTYLYIIKNKDFVFLSPSTPNKSTLYVTPKFKTDLGFNPIRGVKTACYKKRGVVFYI